MTPDGEESSNAATTRDFSGRTPWPVKSMMGDIRPDVRLIPCADKRVANRSSRRNELARGRPIWHSHLPDYDLVLFGSGSRCDD